MKEKDESTVAFGKRIAFLRRAQNISQEEFAFTCGLNRTYVGCIERGEKAATIPTIVKLAKGLNVTLPVLFDY